MSGREGPIGKLEAFAEDMPRNRGIRQNLRLMCYSYVKKRNHKKGGKAMDPINFGHLGCV